MVTQKASLIKKMTFDPWQHTGFWNLIFNVSKLPKNVWKGVVGSEGLVSF